MGAPCNSSARSTMAMARSTPAQKPRGLASSICMSLAFETIPDQQRGTAGNGGVGQIERGKVVTAPVEVEEVHHVTVGDAVDQVAQRAAENEGQRETEQLLGVVL